MNSKILFFSALLGLSGCRSIANLPPPEAAPEQATLNALDRIRSAFERQDRLSFMAEVDPAFQPNLNQLEQRVIDVSLRARDIRLDLLPGRRSYGHATIGINARWTRSWTNQGSGQVERKQGESSFVFDRASGKLVRIDGEDPFAP